MNKSLEKKYNYWSWRTVIVLMIGYALYYFLRKNLSVAIPAMEQELGISKALLGTYLTVNGIIYGLSRFVNGVIADRFSKKRLMALGLGLSALVNFAIAFSPKMNGVFDLLTPEGKATTSLIILIGGLWVINGYLQGMGVPPCLSLMANWIRPSQLATRQSVWNASHSLGAGLVAVLCGAILSAKGYSAWNLCFVVPAAISLVGIPVILLGIKDKPSSVGLPPVEKLDSGEFEVSAEGDPEVPFTDETRKEKKEDKNVDEISSTQYKKVLRKMVFFNPYIWILALANFCIYIIRFTILDWGSSFLTQYKGMDIAAAASIVATSELVGGILGMLVAGWLTDHLFKSKAHITCFFCTLGATLSFFLFWKSGNMTASVIFLVLSSFFIYGPQALLGICASQQATKRAAATANGILGIVGYLSPIVSGAIFGALADKSWDLVFLVAVIFGAVGCVVISTMWAAPANGYKKLEKVLEEV